MHKWKRPFLPLLWTDQNLMWINLTRKNTTFYVSWSNEEFQYIENDFFALVISPGISILVQG